uniref:Uncharacterized protein n=1 Tax=Leptocylindrus danicus TaxID=163516 RepID=A0A7S2LFX1_9STRA
MNLSTPPTTPPRNYGSQGYPNLPPPPDVRRYAGGVNKRCAEEELTENDLGLIAFPPLLFDDDDDHPPPARRLKPRFNMEGYDGFESSMMQPLSFQRSPSLFVTPPPKREEEEKMPSLPASVTCLEPISDFNVSNNHDDEPMTHEQKPVAMVVPIPRRASAFAGLRDGCDEKQGISGGLPSLDMSMHSVGSCNFQSLDASSHSVSFARTFRFERMAR